MANIGLVRVSTREQNEARQIEALEKYNIDKWFIDKASGKDMNRPQLQAMLEYIREGDTVYIHDLSRLARNTKDLLELVEIFKNKGVSLVSNKENIDSSTPTGKLMLTMIAAIAEFERQNLLDRQAEGIAIAKREGKFKGKQVKQIDQATFDAAYNDYSARKISKIEFAKQLNISRPTLDRLLEERNVKDFRKRFESGEDATQLMDEMEGVFNIPLLNDEKWNKKHKDLILLYREISNSRDL